MTAPIIIENYDPRWPERYEQLRSRIAPALGPIAVAIQHVGSTAIPGLAAKAIIDVDVILRSAADLPEAIVRLATLGYQHRGDLGVPGREAFRAPCNEFPHHLYVHPPESREYLRHVTFRDYLRTHPEGARTYERLNQTLAIQYRNDPDGYNEGKAEFVEAVLRRAVRMREHSGPGPRILS